MRGYFYLMLLCFNFFSTQLWCQCSVTVPTNVTYNILGRSTTISNVQINGSGNTVAVAPGANFTVSFDWSIDPTITACPGCITYLYFGLSGTSVPASPTSTSYPNTHCMGSVFGGQNSSSSGSFTAPTTPGYYFITMAGSWTFWCHQYPVSHGCNRVIGVVTVGVPDPFQGIIDSVTNISSCGGNDGVLGAVGLNGSGCYTFDWEGPNGYTGNQAIINNLYSGDYTVTVTDATGCDTVLNYTLAEPSLTNTVELGADLVLCQGDSVVLDGFLDGVTYEWQDGSTDTTFTVNSAGEYWVIVDSAGCIDTDTVLVEYMVLSPVDLGVDTFLCENASLVLDATRNAATYEWQDGSANATFTVNNAGEYWVIVDSAGCSVSDTIDVSVLDLSGLQLREDTLLCGTELLTLDATAMGAAYLWQDGSTNATYIVNSAGTYTVVWDSLGCLVADSVLISYTNLPTLDLGEDSTLCQGDTLVLNATMDSVTYLWQDGSTNATLTVTESDLYTLTLSHYCGTVTDEVQVDVEICGCFMNFPNAFTPNADGVNDVFGPVIDCTVEEFRLTIFNRWGQKLFETTDHTEKWNGAVNGILQSKDVYIYTLEYRGLGETEMSVMRGELNVLY